MAEDTVKWVECLTSMVEAIGSVPVITKSEHGNAHFSFYFLVFQDKVSLGILSYLRTDFIDQDSL